MSYNGTILAGNPSSKRGWKKLYQKGYNITTDVTANFVDENVTSTLIKDVVDADTSSAMTSLIVGSVALVAVMVLLLAMVYSVRKKSTTSAATPRNANVEAPVASENETPRRPTSSINFGQFRNRENNPVMPLPSSNSAKKRKTVEEIPLSEITKDLFFLLQEDNNRYTVVDVTDRNSFMNSNTTLLERSKMERHEEIKFNNDDGELVKATIICKGDLRTVTEFAENIPADIVDENVETDKESLLPRIVVLEAGLQQLKTQVQNLEIEMKEQSAKTEDRLIVIEGKRNTQRTTRPTRVVTKITQLKTMINGIPRVISSLPNFTAVINQKILDFRSHSSALSSTAHEDIRPMLYENQAYFVAHYGDVNACAGALMSLLVGDGIANSAFLPPLFYDQGPRAKAGQMKECLSFKVTTTFYLALDLLISCIFIPDHRASYISRARFYINSNVDSHNSHPEREITNYPVQAYPEGPAFSREEAVVENFKAEKAANASKDACMNIYRWAANFGLEYSKAISTGNGATAADAAYYQESEGDGDMESIFDGNTDFE